MCIINFIHDFKEEDLTHCKSSYKDKLQKNADFLASGGTKLVDFYYADNKFRELSSTKIGKY